MYLPPGQGLEQRRRLGQSGPQGGQPHRFPSCLGGPHEPKEGGPRTELQEGADSRLVQSLYSIAEPDCGAHMGDPVLRGRNLGAGHRSAQSGYQRHGWRPIGHGLRHLTESVHHRLHERGVERVRDRKLPGRDAAGRKARRQTLQPVHPGAVGDLAGPEDPGQVPVPEPLDRIGDIADRCDIAAHPDPESGRRVQRHCGTVTGTGASVSTDETQPVGAAPEPCTLTVYGTPASRWKALSDRRQPGRSRVT